MIQELQNLKVRALSVDLPEPYNVIYIHDGKLKLRLEHISTWKRDIDLPKGKWKILGRADELNNDKLKDVCFYHVVSDTRFYSNYGNYKGVDFRDIIDNSFRIPLDSWKSYIAANNLTNELILIQQQ